MAKNVMIDEGGDDAVDETVIDETKVGASAKPRAGAPADVVDEDEVDDQPKKAKLPPRAIVNEDGTISLPLSEPVSYGIKTASGIRRETLDELVFHPLYGADLRIMAQASDEMKGPVALARATRIATNRMVVIFDKMRERDVKAATDIINFLAE
jgi:hypothetical protein